MRGGVVSRTPGSVIICQAAGANVGNVYTSFAAANAARVAAGPGAVLYIVGDVTAEATVYDFSNLRIEGVGGVAPNVTLPAGSTATWSASAIAAFADFEMRNLNFQWRGSAAFIESPTDGLYALIDFYSAINTSGATAPFIHAAGSAGIYIDALFAASLSGGTGRPIVQLAAGGSTCAFNFGSYSSLASNSITGGNSGAFTINNLTAGLTATGSPPAAISHTQTGATAITYNP